jgi:hypothetical protein
VNDDKIEEEKEKSRCILMAWHKMGTLSHKRHKVITVWFKGRGRKLDHISGVPKTFRVQIKRK